MRTSSLGFLGALGLAGIALGACTTNDFTQSSGIGFREERFAEMQAMRTYRECRDEALLRDQQARQTASPALYVTSARLLESCEADLGPNAAQLAVEERMRAYALSIQNYIKGGDLEQARQNLHAFEGSFAGNDLYYPDGSSFTETMKALLGEHDEPALGQFSLLNVNDDVKSELRRVRYWKRN